jgi:hypothetical protein
MSHLEDSVLDRPEHPAGLSQAVQPAVEVETRPEVYGVVAEFDSPERLLEGIRAVRERGYGKLDAYTPFPVHGIEDALEIRRSRLGWIVAGMGAFGALAALALQWWVGTTANPLVIGGKPLFALEYSIPVIFELTVLFAAFGAVFGMLFLNGLPRLYHPVFNHPRFRRATDDRFLLAIEADGAGFEPQRAAEALDAAGGRYTEVVAA